MNKDLEIGDRRRWWRMPFDNGHCRLPFHVDKKTNLCVCVCDGSTHFTHFHSCQSMAFLHGQPLFSDMEAARIIIFHFCLTLRYSHPALTSQNDFVKFAASDRARVRIRQNYLISNSTIIQFSLILFLLLQSLFGIEHGKNHARQTTRWTFFSYTIPHRHTVEL